MAVTPTHIPTEILRLLTAQEAAEYRLVPFAREAGRIRCYGETGHDYTAAAEELEVLYGWQVEVVPIAADDLQRLLLQHYRPGAQTASAAAGRTAEIGQGRQFLFALVGEALRDNASDIHLEPYEQRCRIRMRIDGKLAERYVVERAQYMPLVNQIKILASLDISEKRLPQDGRIGYDRDGEKFDVRVSTLPTIYGEKVVLRLLTRRVELLELRNLGFSARQYEDYCRAIARPFGMVLICGILLGPGLGALAAGIGSMMADLIGGYMAWVPGTFAIKALTALLGGWLYHRMAGKGMNTITRVVLCGIPAEIIMVLGYFVYEVGMEVVMGSSMGAAAAAVVLGVPMNIVQGIAGIIVGAVLLPVLSHASAEMGEKIRA